jgi:mannosyltransferase
MARRGPLLVAVGSTLLAALLGRYHLGANSLWYDEAFTLGVVDRPLGDALWRITHWELNQSPYYVLMLVWHRLGDTEQFLRAPSAAFAVLSIPLVFVVGRRLLDPWTGAIAAAFVAGHALVVQWSQQLRGYSLALFLVLLATWLLLQAVDRVEASTWWSVAYGVVAAVCAYTHLVAGLVIVAHALSLLVLRPRPWAFVRVAGPIAGVLTLPLAWYVLTRQGDPLAWVGELSGEDHYNTLALFAGGAWQNLVVVTILLLFGGYVAVRSARGASTPTEAWRWALVVLWFAVPFAVVVGSTYTVKALLVARFLIVIIPALGLLVATAVRWLPRGVGAAAVVLLAVVAFQGVRDWYDVGNFEDWRGAVRSVSASLAPGDAVIPVPGRAVHAVRYYGPGLQTTSPNDFAAVGAERLWVLDRTSQGATEWPVPEGFEPWLHDTYELEETRRYENVAVFLYVRR